MWQDRTVIKSGAWRFLPFVGTFWRDRTIDLVLVASSCCTAARHGR
ncbi:hypothetical protein AB5J62_31550 [Amycolatopsis sp. cg5]